MQTLGARAPAGFVAVLLLLLNAVLTEIGRAPLS